MQDEKQEIQKGSRLAGPQGGNKNVAGGICFQKLSFQSGKLSVTTLNPGSQSRSRGLRVLSWFRRTLVGTSPLAFG